MSAPDPGPVVLAFGGNALLPDPLHPEEQKERAAALAEVTDTDTLQLLPGGAPLVFLHAAARHVAHEPVFDLAGARAAATRYAERIGRDALPAQLAVWEGDAVPDWAAALPFRRAGRWTLIRLPD